MIELSRATDAARLNELVNHPSIYPLVRGASDGAMDLTPIVANPNNHVLIAEHGAVVFGIRQHGLYEMTAAALPEFLRDDGAEMVREAIGWAFTHTDAVEIYVRVPEVDHPAYPLAAAIGFDFDFDVTHGWIYDGAPVRAEVRSLTIQKWMRTAPGLEEAGRAFHAEVQRELSWSGIAGEIESDDLANRYAGAAFSMVSGGQPAKGVIFYNRFALMASRQIVTLLGTDPVALGIGGQMFEVHGKNLFLSSSGPKTLN